MIFDFTDILISNLLGYLLGAVAENARMRYKELRKWR